MNELPAGSDPYACKFKSIALVLRIFANLSSGGFIVLSFMDDSSAYSPL